MKLISTTVLAIACAGLTFSAFANMSCNQMRQQCANNKMPQATCEKRMTQCQQQSAKKHEMQMNARSTANSMKNTANMPSNAKNSMPANPSNTADTSTSTSR